MLKNKTYMWFVSLALAFIFCLIYLACSAQKEAKAVSDGVLRFHIVANSDSEEDQSLKLKVRDGIAELTSRLFADVENKEEAISVAKDHKQEIAAAATEVLRANGCVDRVTVEIKNLYFPTKRYENVFFPAGNYDAIHITIGEGKGQNFWCVMFPALCVPSVSTENDRLLADVLEEGEVELVTHPYTLKFKTAEWLGKLKHLFE